MWPPSQFAALQSVEIAAALQCKMRQCGAVCAAWCEATAQRRPL